MTSSPGGATERPWRNIRGHIFSDALPRDGSHTVCLMTITNNNVERAEANAALIVAAVNSYNPSPDSKLEAYRKALEPKPAPDAAVAARDNRHCPNGGEHGNCLYPDCVSSCPGRPEVSARDAVIEALNIAEQLEQYSTPEQQKNLGTLASIAGLMQQGAKCIRSLTGAKP